MAKNKLFGLLLYNQPWYIAFVGMVAGFHHHSETFSALLALCAGNSPVTGEFPSQRTVTRSFDVSFDLRLNKRLSKQSRRWFETPWRSLWRRCNGSKPISNDKLLSLNSFISYFLYIFQNSILTVKVSQSNHIAMNWDRHLKHRIERLVSVW